MVKPPKKNAPLISVTDVGDEYVASITHSDRLGIRLSKEHLAAIFRSEVTAAIHKNFIESTEKRHTHDYVTNGESYYRQMREAIKENKVAVAVYIGYLQILKDMNIDNADPMFKDWAAKHPEAAQRLKWEAAHFKGLDGKYFGARRQKLDQSYAAKAAKKAKIEQDKATGIDSFKTPKTQLLVLNQKYPDAMMPVGLRIDGNSDAFKRKRAASDKETQLTKRPRKGPNTTETPESEHA